MAKQPRILAGETAAITGAARGIGRATAEALLRRGMKVAIGDVDLEAARRTASELGASTVALPLDVTDRASFTASGRSTCSSTTPASCRSGASSTRTT
jgi:NAD(P)-dependent dehydrogenase (short-subunit alcohol dehydrogenase family)